MKKIFIVLTLFYVVTTLGQSSESPFISYKYKITPSITYFDSSSKYFLEYNDGKETHNITFKPNTQKQLVLGLNYHLLSFNIGFTPSFMKVNQDTEKTKQFNLGLNISGKRWFHTLNLAYRKGYFMDYNGIDNFYSKISTSKIYINTSFVLNDKFSYKSLLKNTEWQKKSAGSFIANASFNITQFDFGLEEEKTTAELYTLMILPSYYYNVIIKKKFMISMGLMAGSGFDFSDNNFIPVYELTTHLRLTYNQENLFSFVAINGTSITQKTKEANFNDFYSTLRIGIGYRFNSSKKMNKTFDDFEQFYKKTLNSVNIFKKKEKSTIGI